VSSCFVSLDVVWLEVARTVINASMRIPASRTGFALRNWQFAVSPSSTVFFCGELRMSQERTQDSGCGSRTLPSFETPTSRRTFLKCSLATGTAFGLGTSSVLAQADAAAKELVTVLNPRNRVPLSFIIDDSTCLVNMGHFCMPQFATCYPQRVDYQKPWKTWPREIPDSFVREFGEWCAEHGVKGK
jgi:hypothetical protein